MAETMGLKNNSVASVRWGQILRKLKNIAGAEVPPPKAKVAKRKLDDNSAPKAKKAKNIVDLLENGNEAEEHSDDETSRAKNKGSKYNDSEVKVEP